ncbi:phosphoribosylanthranilate isomerase [Pseudorhodoplanes sinuspersici]|uniref:N-(5'-phosphoribosyl)anthranilate isomerase n=1 Tax=Pseudorhodoplanes sinuspersici TaxID=1235591 RepID=A0A1W6ZQA2_9HYPH|nr:phosphoribosylanthranilate isomerase [Pseudorhodoplanes sinuspersici]ARP99541.1 N-(5'-phosphoribosyl)anthranilate isomerase [Pseudorhodoplanes sinuspersici]RKE70504.1 phosphoribosylanthranilate isomerase [Pseudorhodoplanes sinuspersici]
MTTLVKICGLRTAAALDAALDAKADFVGFVFFPPSPRHVELADASALAARVRDRARTVALTVNADDALLEAIIAALKPNMLQLHGKETPERVAHLRTTFSLPVMKALPVETESDLAAIADYAGIADWLLFDARAPKDATRPGGLGRPFDWSLLKALDPGLRFMLSGGLDPANVAEALTIAQAPAVDVSSGVESEPGIKDPDKIRAFIRAVRSQNASAKIEKPRNILTGARS